MAYAPGPVRRGTAHLIRDARRRSARGLHTYAAHKGDCGNVLAAVDFLNRLDSQHLSRRRLQQPHPDVWAIERPTLRSRSIPFLRWGTARRLCPPDLVIEHSAAELPGHFQAEEEHRTELLRCFNDTALPLEVRVAAALVRLYAQHSPRHSNTAGKRYLLPGHRPGRPRNPLGLADTLRHHGLPARAARNTAMMDALVDLPPMAFADLIGIHPKTAERWATLAGGNWSEYLAIRAAPQGQAVEQDIVPGLIIVLARGFAR